MKRIYLDYAATTPVDEEVIRVMNEIHRDIFGNASSIHLDGRRAREAIERARDKILRKLNARNHKLIFTSGGTESNNTALKGIAFRRKRGHIITSKIEHDCILKTCEWLEKLGFRITYLPVDSEGFVDLKKLEEEIGNDTILVSINHGNNEIGTIEDVKAIGEICEDKGVYFHSDACQSFCKTPIDLEEMKIDLLTINAHKIYGPKGVGGLVIRDGVEIEPLMHGGGHEFGLRSGTENVPGIVGFSKAVEIFKEDDIRKMKKLRDMLIKGILELEDTKLNGPKGNKRLCNNVNALFRYVDGEALLLYLDSNGISVSTGSACSSSSSEPSHVLTAIGLDPKDARCSLRFTLGKWNEEEDVRFTLDVLEEGVNKLREVSALKG
jgi:cysteine desulfurase